MIEENVSVLARAFDDKIATVTGGAEAFASQMTKDITAKVRRQLRLLVYWRVVW